MSHISFNVNQRSVNDSFVQVNESNSPPNIFSSAFSQITSDSESEAPLSRPPDPSFPNPSTLNPSPQNPSLSNPSPPNLSSPSQQTSATTGRNVSVILGNFPTQPPSTSNNLPFNDNNEATPSSLLSVLPRNSESQSGLHSGTIQPPSDFSQIESRVTSRLDRLDRYCDAIDRIDRSIDDMITQLENPHTTSQNEARNYHQLGNPPTTSQNETRNNHFVEDGELSLVTQPPSLLNPGDFQGERFSPL